MTVIRFLWDRTTPFGTPVEPDVNIIIATSSGTGENVSKV